MQALIQLYSKQKASINLSRITDKMYEIYLLLKENVFLSPYFLENPSAIPPFPPTQICIVPKIKIDCIYVSWKLDVMLYHNFLFVLNNS